MDMEPSSESEKKFLQQLQSKISVVKLYEDLNLLNHAFTVLPVEELHIKATEKLSLLINDNEMSFEDLLLFELLKWFKFSFFSWVNVPKCDSCDEQPESKGLTTALSSELRWGVTRVEHYFCKRCQTSIRFPRYSHPKKLLETRRGRCGEWANCFTFLCRALGYEARLVMDWNDHMWTEVFSFANKKWLHCDPCENICNKPLIYEIGWKKDISYIIAFSKDEIQDVTWRYTQNFDKVLQQRKLCREDWLLNCIISLTNSLQTNMSPARKNELQFRRIAELVEFLTPPKVIEEELGGRTSGSLAWRLARGETSVLTTKVSHIFKLSAPEIECKSFHIKYSCALDKYIRISDNASENEKWDSLVFDYDGMFRKVENDWNTTYLARTSDALKGLITWKFNFKDTGLAIGIIKLNFRCKTFENGLVKLFVYPENEEHIPKIYEPEDVISLESEDFRGSTGLTISAELSGGSGHVAWQHTQLFRQSLDSTEFPFEVQILLDKL